MSKQFKLAKVKTDKKFGGILNDGSQFWPVGRFCPPVNIDSVIKKLPKQGLSTYRGSNDTNTAKYP
jgi:hypothetical protein